MPSTTEKQARFMAACAHGANYDSCPPDDVSKEFNQADKGSELLSKAAKHKRTYREWKEDNDEMLTEIFGLGNYIYNSVENSVKDASKARHTAKLKPKHDLLHKFAQSVPPYKRNFDVTDVKVKNRREIDKKVADDVKTFHNYGLLGLGLKRAFKEETDDKLDKPTPSLEAIAKKHGISMEQAQAALEAGIKVEIEHTSSRETAAEIARDHLSERPDYYQKLKQVEEENLSELSTPTLNDYMNAVHDKVADYWIKGQKKKARKHLKGMAVASRKLVGHYVGNKAPISDQT